jgi:cytochrome c oxidase subunit 2
MVLSASLLAIFFFSLLYNAFSRKIVMNDCIPYNNTFKDGKVKQVDDHHYEVYIIARMWNFDPDEIHVPPGSTVDFYLTSIDVVHGFNIENKGLNLMAVPGAINKATVHFEDEGEYHILCHEYCGAGHQNMMSKVLVTTGKN